MKIISLQLYSVPFSDDYENVLDYESENDLLRFLNLYPSYSVPISGVKATDTNNQNCIVSITSQQHMSNVAKFNYAILTSVDNKKYYYFITSLKTDSSASTRTYTLSLKWDVWVNNFSAIKNLRVLCKRRHQRSFGYINTESNVAEFSRSYHLQKISPPQVSKLASLCHRYGNGTTLSNIIILYYKITLNPGYNYKATTGSGQSDFIYNISTISPYITIYVPFAYYSATFTKITKLVSFYKNGVHIPAQLTPIIERYSSEINYSDFVYSIQITSFCPFVRNVTTGEKSNELIVDLLNIANIGTIDFEKIENGHSVFKYTGITAIYANQSNTLSPVDYFIYSSSELTTAENALEGDYYKRVPDYYCYPFEYKSIKICENEYLVSGPYPSISVLLEVRSMASGLYIREEARSGSKDVKFLSYDRTSIINNNNLPISKEQYSQFMLTSSNQVNTKINNAERTRDYQFIKNALQIGFNSESISKSLGGIADSQIQYLNSVDSTEAIVQDKQNSGGTIVGSQDALIDMFIADTPLLIEYTCIDDDYRKAICNDIYVNGSSFVSSVSVNHREKTTYDSISGFIIDEPYDINMEDFKEVKSIIEKGVRKWHISSIRERILFSPFIDNNDFTNGGV